MSVAEERRIVIVGKTGNGKSSLGNNLLERRIFDESGSFVSVTECCRLETAKRIYDENEYDITVVDTPGLFRPTDEKSMAKQALEISESLNICENPHAFLLVIRYDSRWSQEDLFTKEALEIIFGPEFLQHTIIVITHVDKMITNTEFEAKWKKSEKLANLIEKCDTRVVRIDNKKFELSDRRDIFRFLDEVSKYGSQSYSYAFQECNMKILEKIEELGTYDGMKAHEQVACIAEDIREAIKLEQMITELNRRDEDLKRRAIVLDKREKAMDERFLTIMKKFKVWKRSAEQEQKNKRAEQKELDAEQKKHEAKLKEKEAHRRKQEAERKEKKAKLKEEEAKQRKQEAEKQEKVAKKKETEAKQKVQQAKQKVQQAKQKVQEANRKKGETDKYANFAKKGTLVASALTGITVAASGVMVPKLGFGAVKAGVLVSSASIFSYVTTHAASVATFKWWSKPDTESEGKKS